MSSNGSLRRRYLARELFVGAVVAVGATALHGPAAAAQTEKGKAEITVLYDAFGKSSKMKLDWGFSAYIEYGGKRILFDTGNDAEIFRHNVQAKGVDLTKLDFAVISHRHGDHTSGLNHLVAINPNLKIYAPKENFGVFGASLPSTFYKREESLPVEMRYYNGKPPETMRFGSAWPAGKFTWINETTEVAPGFHLILLKGPWGVDLEVMEMSLAIDTPNGIVLVVGCSHPTLEKIVEAAKAIIKKPNSSRHWRHAPAAGQAGRDHAHRHGAARNVAGVLHRTRPLHRRARLQGPEGELRRPLSLCGPRHDAGIGCEGDCEGGGRPAGSIRHGCDRPAQLPRGDGTRPAARPSRRPQSTGARIRLKPGRGPARHSA